MTRQKSKAFRLWVNTTIESRDRSQIKEHSRLLSSSAASHTRWFYFEIFNRIKRIFFIIFQSYSVFHKLNKSYFDKFYIFYRKIWKMLLIIFENSPYSLYWLMMMMIFCAFYDIHTFHQYKGIWLFFIRFIILNIIQASNLESL